TDNCSPASTRIAVSSGPRSARGPMHAVVMLAAFSGVVLAAEPIKLAAIPLSAVEIDAQRAAFFSEHLSSSMASSQVRVVTPQEINALLGIERQKVLLGCSDAASTCMAELGNALG